MYENDPHYGKRKNNHWNSKVEIFWIKLSVDMACSYFDDFLEKVFYGRITTVDPAMTLGHSEAELRKHW